MKRALVGLSTPLGYDYRNPIQPMTDTQRDIPNPVLENTTGILLCYDEIWFPERDFCPLDMHDLPYVKFISDDPGLLDRAKVAQEQFMDFARGEEPALTATDNYGEKMARIAEAAPFESAFDNHSRGGGHFGMGNAGGGDLFLGDLGIAEAMDMDLDVVMSSRFKPHAGLDDAVTFLGSQPWKLDAAEMISGVNTVDWLGKAGAYHESIEDLRAHARVREFREFLAAVEEPDSDAVKLTETVNELADKHARDVMEKNVKGRGAVHTVGTAGAGWIGNLIQPGLGNALQMGLGAASWLKQRSDSRKVSWSLFVLDSRRMRIRR